MGRVGSALREAADAANVAWTPERNIRIFITPGGISIEGRIINRDERQEYASSRICTFDYIETMTANWLVTLVDQVCRDLATHEGTPLHERAWKP